MLRLPPLLSLTILLSALLPGYAGPLQQARVNRIVNEVRVVDPRAGIHPAALQEVVKDDLGIKTGQKSRAELLFQDETLTRLGAETFFSFQPGTRDMTLEQGTMLLQVPKGLGGAKIRTAAVTAAITGTTILMEYFPGKIVKVLVLEGSLRLSLNSRLGESITLSPGRMLMMKPGDKRLPEPIDVDLAKVIKTSSLVQEDSFSGKGHKGSATLPSMGLIAAEIGRQQGLKGKAGLVDTNLIIKGNGNLVTVASAEQLDALQNGLGAASTITVASLNSSTTNTNTTVHSTEIRTDAGDGNRPITERPSGSSSGTTGGTSGSGSNGGSGPDNGSGGDNNNDGSGGNDGGNSGGGGTGNGGTVTPPPPPPPTPPSSNLATINSPNPYVYTKSTKLNLASAIIATGSTSDAGAVYYHATSAFTPTDYLFGSTTPTDTAFKLDLTFGLRDRVTPPVAGVAVFRFASLVLGEMKSFAGKNSRSDLALVSESGISSIGSKNDIELNDLHSLFFAAANGNISLTNKITGNDDFRALDLYSRNGDVKMTGDFDLKDALVYVNAGGDVLLQNKVEAKAVSIYALGNISLTKDVKANFLSLRGTIVDLGPKVDTSVLNVTAASLIAGSSLAVDSGTLDVDTGGINATGRSLLGFTDIKSQGNVRAQALSASGSIIIGGTLNLGTAGATPTLAAPTISIAQGIYGKPVTGSSQNGLSLTILADQVLLSSAAGGINGINLEGADKFITGLTPAADGGTLNIGTTSKPIAGDVTIAAPVSTASGDSLTSAILGGKGGTVSVMSNSHINVSSSVRVSSSDITRASKTGGTIHLETIRTSGAGITVQNSGQLLSLLSATAAGPGGKIEFISAGADINVGSGTVQADRGLVNIYNSGANGTVVLTNANISGDVIKVGAMGSNGELRIGGGSIDAASTLKLYAHGSSGTIRFVDDVTLSSGTSKIIAANTVTIDDGKRVQINGRAADVYTNDGRFSGAGGTGATTGRFTGSGVNVTSYSNVPGY